MYMYKNMFLHEKTQIFKERLSIFDSLKTKDREIRGNCNLLIKAKFHELERSSSLNRKITNSNK